MRVLVCGGRDLNRSQAISWLERFARKEICRLTPFAVNAPITHLIHGGAFGADQAGADWGKIEGAYLWAFPANWGKHGRAAGPIRNAQMLAEGKPDIVVALPGGRGTADMVRQAKAAGVPVIEVERIND